MRSGSVALRRTLAGSFDHHYVADVFYDGERRLADVPLRDVAFDEDADAAIQMSGSCTVVWSDEFGRSVSPEEVGDPLSPFGAELHISVIVSAGPFVERVPLGPFRITNVPNAVDEEMLFRGDWITTGSTVELEFKDRTDRVDQDRFDVPTAPTDLTSTWAEIGRITDLQLTRSVADVPITRAVMYEENRLDAVYKLMELFDAVPHMTLDGTLAARPNAWPAAVDALVRGDLGTVVKVGRSMESRTVYNRVAFRGKSGDQEKILASAQIMDGPLRVANADGSRGPFGRKTYFLSSDLVTTQAQAQEWVDRELPRVSQIRSVIVPVTETFNPLRERGDVVTIERSRETLTGRILKISRGVGHTQDMDLEVLRG